MPISSYVMNEGELVLGAVGSSVTATAQVTSGAVDWEENVEDPVPTLSGEELEGEATYTATLSGTVVQDDLADTGLTVWTWTNKGQIVPFQFTPAAVTEKVITGNVRIRPLKVGGDVKKKNTADFEWACIGEPTIGADL